MTGLHKLSIAMTEYERGNVARIQHFQKVHNFARWIGEAEGLDVRTQLTLEAAALVHDIGIRPALEKHGTAAGPVQEREGIVPAREMLTALGFDRDLIDRVCYLVGHHHTYTDVDGIDYRILLEADFLVNSFEGNSTIDAILAAKANFFRTKTGTMLLDAMFDLGR